MKPFSNTIITKSNILIVFTSFLEIKLSEIEKKNAAGEQNENYLISTNFPYKFNISFKQYLKSNLILIK